MAQKELRIAGFTWIKTDYDCTKSTRLKFPAKPGCLRWFLVVRGISPKAAPSRLSKAGDALAQGAEGTTRNQ
jgi:hypothetical protein